MKCGVNASKKRDNLGKLKEPSPEAGLFTVKDCSMELFAHAAYNIIMIITNVQHMLNKNLDPQKVTRRIQRTYNTLKKLFEEGNIDPVILQEVQTFKC